MAAVRDQREERVTHTRLFYGLLLFLGVELQFGGANTSRLGVHKPITVDHFDLKALGVGGIARWGGLGPRTGHWGDMWRDTWRRIICTG